MSAGEVTKVFQNVQDAVAKAVAQLCHEIEASHLTRGG